MLLEMGCCPTQQYDEGDMTASDLDENLPFIIKTEGNNRD